MRLSVIIPCLNEESFIGPCVASVRAQSNEVADLEVIVVDAGSTDQTIAVAESVGASVVHHKRSTIAAQRNTGASTATGDVFAFLDADCTVAPGWAKAGMALFVDEKVLGGGSPPDVPLTDTTWVQRDWSFLKRKRWPTRMSVQWIPSANVWVRRSTFEEIGGFTETLETCEDADLGFRISDRGQMIADPTVRVYHHREPRNLRQFFRKEIWHGKNSFTGITQGRWTLAELPSLVAPVYFLLGFVAVLVFFFMQSFSNWPLSLAIASVLLWLLLPFAYTLRAILTKGNAIRFLPYFAIYCVYFSARTTSMAIAMMQRISRAILPNR